MPGHETPPETPLDTPRDMPRDTPGRWHDLTRPLDATLGIYAEGAYSDPPLSVTPWCDIAGAGFAVSRIGLGTQTGTHIDAPCHFAPGGATLDRLDPGLLVGPCLCLGPADLADAGALGTACAAHRGETMLLIDARARPRIGTAALARLLALPVPAWIVAGALLPEGDDPHAVHRALAGAGRFLVEDLDEAALPTLGRRAEVVVLPLRLTGVSGSPVRILLRLGGGAGDGDGDGARQKTRP